MMSPVWSFVLKDQFFREIKFENPNQNKRRNYNYNLDYFFREIDLQIKKQASSYLKTFFFCKEDTVSPVGGVAYPPPLLLPAAVVTWPVVLLPNNMDPPPLVVWAAKQLGRLCVDETLAMAIFCMPCLMAAQSGSCSR